MYYIGMICMYVCMYNYSVLDEPGFSLRLAAQNGDVSPIEYLLGKDPNLIHEADKKGWQALHEAIRGGYLQVDQ